jgi:hypothetical protein
MAIDIVNCALNMVIFHSFLLNNQMVNVIIDAIYHWCNQFVNLLTKFDRVLLDSVHSDSDARFFREPKTKERWLVDVSRAIPNMT